MRAREHRRSRLGHPYRRLLASEQEHLPDVDLAEAAGWRDLRVLKRSYQQSDAAAVLRVVASARAGVTPDTPRR